MRNADPQYRQQRGKFIQPRVLEIPGHKTKQTAQHKPDQGGQQGEAQSVAHGGHDLRSHRPVAGNGGTQIALQSTPDPGHKLFRVRTIKPVQLNQLRLQVSRGVRRQNRHQRITGCQVHQAKTNQRHPQHDGQGINQSPQQKAEHASTPKLQLKSVQSGRSQPDCTPSGAGPMGPDLDHQSIDTGAKSTNQLRGCTKPLTLVLMARGPTSWAIQTKGASSTMRACNLASASSRLLSSN